MLPVNNNPMVIYYCCSTKWLHFCLFSCTLLLSTSAFSAGALVQLKHTAPFAELHLGKQSQVGPGSCQQGTAEVVTAPLACLSSTETLPTTALPTRAAARKSRIARCHNKLLASWLAVSTIFGPMEFSWQTTNGSLPCIPFVGQIEQVLLKLKSFINCWHCFRLPQQCW